MNHSPLLRKTMSEIEAILQREGIEGVVMLHKMEEETNHFVEFLMKVDSEKSCLFIDGQCLRIKAKSNDPKVNYSAGMLKAMTDVMMRVTGNLKDFSDKLNEIVNLDFKKGQIFGLRDN
jgi:hypothetical protein